MAAAAGRGAGTVGHPAASPLAANVARHPVCLMSVMGEGAPPLDYQGTSYRCCSAECRENFQRYPAQYAKQ